jgi:hypothetical protein
MTSMLMLPYMHICIRYVWIIHGLKDEIVFFGQHKELMEENSRLREQVIRFFIFNPVKCIPDSDQKMNSNNLCTLIQMQLMAMRTGNPYGIPA